MKIPVYSSVNYSLIKDKEIVYLPKYKGIPFPDKIIESGSGLIRFYFFPVVFLVSGVEYIRLFEIHPGVDFLFFQETFPAPVVDGGAGASQQPYGFRDLYQFVFLCGWL